MPDARDQADYFANREEQIGQQATMMGVSTEIMTLILDPAMIIERIRRDLKGEVLMTKWVKDKESGTQVPKNYWMKIGTRVMNDKGIEMVVSILNGYVNRNSLFTQLDEEEIYKIMLLLARNVNALFYSKGKEYELDNAYKSIVKDKICDMAFFALKSSQNKALMDAVTKSWSVRELKGYEGKKQGIGDLLLAPFKRNKEE